MTRKPLPLLVALTLLLHVGLETGWAQDASPAAGHDGEGLILPPDAPVADKTVDAWAASWTEWFYRTQPTACEPSPESEQMWFLPPAEGAEVRRPCVMPPGTALFFPLLPHAMPDAASCLANIESYLATMGELEILVELDGHLFPDVAPFALEATALPMATPGADPLREPVDGYELKVSCGYGLLIAPLPPGEHTARLGFGDGAIEFDLITHEITVESPS